MTQAGFSGHVYFDPPESMQLQYPCIVYQIDTRRTEFAGNKPYTVTSRYQVTVIHRDPDDIIPESIAWLESALMDRHYVANNLHHSVFTLYY